METFIFTFTKVKQARENDNIDFDKLVNLGNNTLIHESTYVNIAIQTNFRKSNGGIHSIHLWYG